MRRLTRLCVFPGTLVQLALVSATIVAMVAMVAMVSTASTACSRSRDTQQPFFFIQMADTQIGMLTDNQGFEQETELFEKAMAEANRLQPAFVIICGDLINKPGDPAQREEFLRICNLLNKEIPLYLVSGNHDVEPEPTAESLRLYRDTIGDDQYSFAQRGVLGIVLNSTVIHRPNRVPGEYQDQLSWLQKELLDAQDGHFRHIIVFLHHSFFLEQPNEPDQYFNIPLERRLVYLELFRKYGVRTVMAGHYHRNSHGRDGDLEMITTGPVGKPLGEDPSGLRIVKVFADRIEHQYYGLNEIPRRVF